MTDVTTPAAPAPFQLTDIEKVNLTLGATDAANNPTTLPSGEVPTWTVSDTNVLSVTASADGLSADVVANGPLGTAQVQVAVGSLTGSLAVQVVASAAASIAVTPGAPTPK